MVIDRRTRLHPGSIHPSTVVHGLEVDLETGVLSAQPLVDEDSRLDQKIDDLYWKDPQGSLLAIENREPDSYRIGEAFFSVEENNVYIYIGDSDLADADRSTYQPQSWINANRSERFLVMSAGIDAQVWATKQYVDDEIANLIGGAPDALNTLRELVDAINANPEFADEILLRLDDLQQNKADKSDVYTKAEVDALELSIIDQIDTTLERFTNATDYTCGIDPDDDDSDLEALWNLRKQTVSSLNPKNILLKQGATTPEQNPIVIDRPGVHVIGWHPPEEGHTFSHINNLVVDLRDNQEESRVVSFTNISFSRFYVPVDSASCTIVFNNCIFKESSALAAFEIICPQTKVYMNNCQVISTTGRCSASSIELYMLNTKLLNTSSGLAFDFVDSEEAYLLNSSVKGYLDFTDANLRVANTYLTTEQDLPFINIDQHSLVTLQRITFETPEVYTSNYIEGTGTAYFDYNIVDISLLPEPADNSRVKQPTVGVDLNGGAGADIYHFFDPLGSSNFFYNDEKARDAIGQMFQASVHSEPLTFIYDDGNNQLNLTLDLDSQDLSDADNIAYLDANNTYTGTNTFTNTTEATTINLHVVNASTITSAYITTDLIESFTHDQTENSDFLASTAYVRTAIEELEGSLQTTELDELGDVQITDGNVNQVLAWNATAATFTERWTNQQISSMWLSDEPELIKDGASVFRLSRIEPPTVPNQQGEGTFTGGYQTTNQILAWNGSKVTEVDGTDGDGAYIPVLSNSLMLYAEEQKTGQSYDGAGKIWLATSTEVQEGDSTNKAVVPSHLYTHYMRTDASNLPEEQKQTARDNLGIAGEFISLDASNLTDPDPLLDALGLALPDEPNILLESDDQGQYQGVKRALPYTKPYDIDFNNDQDNQIIYQDNDGVKFHLVDFAGSAFINVESEIAQTNYVVLPTLSGGYDALQNFLSVADREAEPRIGPVVVRKKNGSTHNNAGTISVTCGSNDDIILSADSILQTNSPDLDSNFNQAQIDLLQFGHTVIFWPIVHEGQDCWYAQGYYHNSGDQTAPEPVVEISAEAIDEALESLFQHEYHDASLSIVHDDSMHRLVLGQHFATQAQVTAGTISDLPIAPDTFKASLDALELSLTQAAMQKANNLSDVASVTLSRANLGLGSAALLNAGTLVGNLPIIAEELQTGYLGYDADLGGLKNLSIPLATTIQDGLVMKATLEDFQRDQANGKVVTADQLHDALATNNDYTDAIRRITNTLDYISTDTVNIVGVVNTYYSLKTDNNSITLTLPDYTNIPYGSEIKVKYRKQTASTDTVVIASHIGQYMDNSTAPYTLRYEGQAIALVRGVDGWEIN